MFVFGVCIDSQEVFDRHCLPAIAAFGGSDATLITSTDKPIASTYNQMLAASLEMDDVEALVLLRQDTQIADPRFLAKIRAAFADDDKLAIIGPTGRREGHPVDSVDDSCMILAPHLAARLRFDADAFAGPSGYDVDFCFRAREQGYRIARRPLDVVRHDPHADSADSYRSAAAVWQGRSATDLRAQLLRRIAARPAAEPADAGLGSAPPPEGGYDLSHLELIEHLPTRVRRVLDVGCGAGARGLAIKQATGAHVTGVEHGHAAAQLARTRLDEVHEVDLTGVTAAGQLPWHPAPYDVIVLADVLSRVSDPDGLLALLVPHLAPDGRVIATIPNVKHWSVVLPLLLHDRWEYQAAGPLHFSNLRFFTMVEIAGVLRRAGLGTFDTCAAQQLPLEDEERLTPLLEAVAAYGGDADEARTLLNAYQYVVVARRD